MSIENDAQDLYERFQAGVDAADAFLTLYGFIDGSTTGRFGWFSLGEGEVFGVECDHQIHLWSSRLRKSIDDGSPVPEILALGNVGAVLRSVIANRRIVPLDSKQLVIALRVLDAAFRGVHTADVSSSNDLSGFVRLRTNLRKGKPLFGSGNLEVFPKPMRLSSPERRGQSSLSELLDVLTVVHSKPHLHLEYYTALDVGRPGLEGFRNIGIIPAIQNADELVWRREPNSRYSISERPHSVAIHERICDALVQLLDMGADLVVLPELVAGPDLVGKLSACLAQRAVAGLATPVLVLAGTQMVADRDGARRNRAVILDGAGSEVWHQDKLHAYCFTAAAQQAASHPLGIDELLDRHEDISLEPRTLVVVDLSASQRLVVLTCEDFIQEQPHRSVIIDICATTLLVPIMAPSRAEPPAQGWVTDAAMNYVRHPGATSVVANSGALVMEEEANRQAWQFGEVRSSPRLRPIWHAVPDEAEGTPIAWLARLDRIA